MKKKIRKSCSQKKIVNFAYFFISASMAFCNFELEKGLIDNRIQKISKIFKF